MYNLRQLISFIEAPDRLDATSATIARYLTDSRFAHKREYYAARLAQLERVQELLPALRYAEYQEVRQLLAEERTLLKRGQAVAQVREQMAKTALAAQILSVTAVDM